MRVSVIGAGTVGRPLIDALRHGDIAGAQLGAVLTRHSRSHAGTALGDLLECGDLVVEAAGQDAVREYGPAVIGAARDLLVVSVGALADERLLAEVTGGPGRLHACAGAIGGLDLLQAAASGGALDEVRLTTRKHPRSLSSAALSGGPQHDGPKVVFSGTARDAATLFPENLNVAATVALATVGLDRTHITLVSDPQAQRTTHVIEASGEIGVYRFEISSRPSPDHPATSAVVPLALIRSVRSLVQRRSSLFV